MWQYICFPGPLLGSEAPMITHSVQKTKQRVYMFQDDFSVKYPSPHPAIYDQMFFPHLGTINFSQCLKSQEFLILAIASYFLGLKKEKSTN